MAVNLIDTDQIQFELLPYGIKSKPIVFNSNEIFDIEIQMGSLLPTGFVGTFFNNSSERKIWVSPFYPAPQYWLERGRSEKEFHHILVKVNGTVILDQDSDFYNAVPEGPIIGLHPNAQKLNIAPRFSGQILEIRQTL